MVSYTINALRIQAEGCQSTNLSEAFPQLAQVGDLTDYEQYLKEFEKTYPLDIGKLGNL